MQGLRLDAECAVDHILRRTDLDPRRVVLFGRSLGGAVAAHAAVRRRPQVAGLVLENTFTRILDLVPHTMPFLRPLVGPGKWVAPAARPAAVCNWPECVATLPAPRRLLQAAARPAPDGTCIACCLFMRGPLLSHSSLAGHSTSWCATTGTPRCCWSSSRTCPPSSFLPWRCEDGLGCVGRQRRQALIPAPDHRLQLWHKWVGQRSARPTRDARCWAVQDEMLPPAQMKELFEVHPKEPWSITYIEGKCRPPHTLHACIPRNTHTPLLRGLPCQCLRFALVH